MSSRACLQVIELSVDFGVTQLQHRSSKRTDRNELVSPRILVEVLVDDSEVTTRPSGKLAVVRVWGGWDSK